MVDRAQKKLRKLKMMIPSTDKKQNAHDINEYLATTIAYNVELKQRMNAYNGKIH